jgi:hypothetical protein
MVKEVHFQYGVRVTLKGLQTTVITCGPQSNRLVSGRGGQDLVSVRELDTPDASFVSSENTYQLAVFGIP